MQLKESIRMTNLILSRRGFLASLSSLLAAPAVVRALALMPIKVWRPPLIWRDGMIACNGVELAVADYPDLFTILGYMHGGCGPKFRLHDHALAPKKIADAMCFIAPRVTDEWPLRQAYYLPSQSPDGGFRREVQPRRQHWFLNEKSGFPFRTPGHRCGRKRQLFGQESKQPSHAALIYRPPSP
jgi:Phage Tail Collar Domain